MLDVSCADKIEELPITQINEYLNDLEEWFVNEGGN
jgi:hypothetical protein